MGRNNFVCVGSREAGHRLAIAQTMTTLCSLHGVNPTEWLTAVLQRISTTSATDMASLLPQSWAPLGWTPVRCSRDRGRERRCGIWGDPDGYPAGAG